MSYATPIQQRTEFSDINELLDAVLAVEQDWTDDQLLQMMLDDHPDYQDET